MQYPSAAKPVRASCPSILSHLTLTLCALLTLGLFSCAGFPSRATESVAAFGAAAMPESETFIPAPLSAAQKSIVDGGSSLVGKASLVVNGKTYPNDCTGLVRAAYAFAEIDLAFRFGSYAGNGVRRLHETLLDEGLLYATRYPAPGDIVFWDNTYDANGNRKADDEFTHVGVVIAVEPDGAALYLHYHYRLGPIIERMNLVTPDDESLIDGKPANAALRMRNSPPGTGQQRRPALQDLRQGL
jgi:cell wall-associated NlpC family hydrolase